MTSNVYRGKHYRVVGTAYDWGVRYEVKPAPRHKFDTEIPEVRFRSGRYHVKGWRDPRKPPWFLRWLYGRRHSIQEAAAIAVDRCRLADEQYHRKLRERKETIEEFKAAIEVQKIVASDLQPEETDVPLPG